MGKPETETLVLCNWPLTNEFACIAGSKFEPMESELASVFKTGYNGDYFKFADISKMCGRLDTSAKKLFDYVCAYFTKINCYGTAENIKREVKFSISEYAQMTNLAISVKGLDGPNKGNKRISDAMSNLRGQIKKDLKDMEQLTWTGHVEKGRNEGDHLDMSLILKSEVKKDYVTIIFGEHFADCLAHEIGRAHV